MHAQQNKKRLANPTFLIHLLKTGAQDDDNIKKPLSDDICVYIPRPDKIPTSVTKPPPSFSRTISNRSFPCRKGGGGTKLKKEFDTSKLVELHHEA